MAPRSNNSQGAKPTPAYDKAGNTANTPLNTTYNVVTDYTWTLSPRRGINNQGASSGSINDVPYVALTEYAVTESFIRQQISNFTSNAGDIIGSVVNTALFQTPNWKNKNDILAPYDALYPRNAPTKNIYILPFFDDINFEINTPVWESIDALGAAGSFAGAASDLAFGKNSQFVKGAARAVGGIGSGILAFSSPKVGALDRPRLWSSHAPRTINIRFPLFNTRNADDWIKNRGLCWTLIRQNLFQKLDTVNSIPPVFYEVLIPGQHYSYASCVTKLTINNKGNMHTFTDPSNKNAICVVPDAYEVNITLEDLVMPSQNLFDAIQSKQAEVTTSVKAFIPTITTPNPTPTPATTVQNIIASTAGQLTPVSPAY